MSSWVCDKSDGALLPVENPHALDPELSGWPGNLGFTLTEEFTQCLSFSSRLRVFVVRPAKQYHQDLTQP
jgi:hypothetical protein